MAITDYGSLATSIKTWTARSDTTFSNQIETFIALHEQRMYNGSGEGPSDPLYCDALNAPELETDATVTITSGVGSVPDDASTVRNIRRSSDLEPLGYMTPSQFAAYEADPSNTGNDPRFYTVETGNLKVSGAYTGDVTVFYYKKLDGISASNPTNAILTAYPLVYLQGCLFEAFSFLQEPELAVGHFARYKAIVAGLNASSNSVRFGGGPLKIRTRQPMP